MVGKKLVLAQSPEVRANEQGKTIGGGGPLDHAHSSQDQLVKLHMSFYDVPKEIPEETPRRKKKPQNWKEKGLERLEGNVVFQFIMKSRMYKVMSMLCITWVSVHAAFFASFALLLMFRSGELLSSAFFDDFDESTLSPLIPVWNTIGGKLPFGGYFDFSIFIAFLISLINLLIATLTMIINCLRIEHHLNFNLLLVFLCVMYGATTAGLCIYPEIYIGMLFIKNERNLVNLVGLYYKVITTEAFSNAFNMVMIMGECCGVKGPQDFWGPYNISIHPAINPYAGVSLKHITALPKWPSGTYSASIVVPPACCKQGDIFGTTESKLKHLLSCASGKNTEIYYHEGCEKVYIDLFRLYYLGSITSSNAGSCVILFTQAFLTMLHVVMRMKNIRLDRKLETQAEIAEKKEGEEDTPGPLVPLVDTDGGDEEGSSSSSDSEDSDDGEDEGES